MVKVKIYSTVTWTDVKTSEQFTYKIVPRSMEYTPIWTGERGRSKKISYAEKIKLGEEGTINPEAPLAKCSLGKTPGDIITINVNGDIYQYKIVSVNDSGLPYPAITSTAENQKNDGSRTELYNDDGAENKIVTSKELIDNRTAFGIESTGFQYSEQALSLTVIAQRINKLIAPKARIGYGTIVNWLIKQKAVKIVKIDGVDIKMPTPLGISIGIYAEAREDYVATLYNKNAQKYIVEHIVDILDN